MKLLNRLPRNQPKFVRITAWVTLIFFAVIGLGMSLKALLISPRAFVMYLLYFLLLGAGSALVLIYAWELFSFLTQKGIMRKLDAFYAERGFCIEMADAINAVVPYPSEEQRALRTFLLVMSEHYQEAEQEVSKVNEPALSMRAFAMMQTAKLRLGLMTGRFEKADRLLTNYRQKLDLAYDVHPDFSSRYLEYADDALEYYMLSAAYYEVMQQPELAAAYRKKAEFQASNRSLAEMEFYQSLLELNHLYGTGQFETAHRFENEMRGMIESFQPPLTQAVKNNLRRAVEQARIFSAQNQNINTALLQERRLPQAGDSVYPPGLMDL